jgi:acyl carrier protein
MESDSLTDEIHRLILRHFPRALVPLRAQMSFETDLAGDSLNFVELIMDTEAAFHCTISDAQAAALLTVGDLVDFIRKNAAGPSSRADLPSP